MTAYGKHINDLHEDGLSLVHADLILRITRAMPCNQWLLKYWAIQSDAMEEGVRERMMWAVKSVARSYRAHFLGEKEEQIEKIS